MQDTDIAKGAETLSNDEARLYRVRHSLAHIMAQAVMALYPGTKLGFGPPVENGFYYDFDLPEPIAAEDLPKIEKRMRRIIQEKQEFVRTELAPGAARERISGMGQPFKDEAAAELDQKGVAVVSFYENGGFIDMCEGPHVANTGEIPAEAWKLDSIAGAYWKGSEKNKMLTRIYGLAFLSKADLQEFLERRKRAQERDHRKLGRELELFHIEDEIGKGLILWLPKGAVLREEIEALAKEFEFRYGYERVATPQIAKQELYFRSGHLPYYKESMFPPLVIDETDRAAESESGSGSAAPAGSGGANGHGAATDGDGKTPSDAPEGGSATPHREVFYLKPMNCPHHHMIYRVRPRSYRELPLRLAEFGTCYRYEQSGELAGLLRVRCLTMNDAHIYCTPDQLRSEIRSLLQMYKELYAVFDFRDYAMRLSLHDPARTDKYVGEETLWQQAEAILREALDELGLEYHVGLDEAAFYGPKIDIQFRNLMGREETVSTIQVDFNAAAKFELRYVDEDGQEKAPVVVHRAPLSTHERITSFLIEHYGGAFPTWLAPVQVRLIAIADDLLPYAERLVAELREDMVRAEVDFSPHSFNKKIRNGTVEKIPILLVIGRKEAEERTVTVRRYKIAEQQTVPFDQFHAELLEEIATRRHVRPEE